MNTEVTIDKRLVEIKPGSFIFEFPNALSTEICKDIIERFENSEDEHYQGRVGKDFNEDQSIKISTDMVISGKEHWKDIDETLFTSLAKALSSVKKEYDFLYVCKSIKKHTPFKLVFYTFAKVLKIIFLLN